MTRFNKPGLDSTCFNRVRCCSVRFFGTFLAQRFLISKSSVGIKRIVFRIVPSSLAAIIFSKHFIPTKRLCSWHGFIPKNFLKFRFRGTVIKFHTKLNCITLCNDSRLHYHNNTPWHIWTWNATVLKLLTVATRPLDWWRERLITVRTRRGSYKTQEKIGLITLLSDFVYSCKILFSQFWRVGCIFLWFIN